MTEQPERYIAGWTATGGGLDEPMSIARWDVRGLYLVLEQQDGTNMVAMVPVDLPVWLEPVWKDVPAAPDPAPISNGTESWDLL